jgi:hypothetical protein
MTLRVTETAKVRSQVGSIRLTAKSMPGATEDFKLELLRNTATVETCGRISAFQMY